MEQLLKSVCQGRIDITEATTTFRRYVRFLRSRSVYTT